MALEGGVASVCPEVHYELTRTPGCIRAYHAIKRSIIRVSSHVFLHGRPFMTSVLAKLTSEWLVSCVAFLMDFELVKAVERLVALATNERFFPCMDQQMSL